MADPPDHAPDIFSEQVVLGLAMLRPDVAPRLFERCSAADFSSDWHRTIAGAIQQLIRRDRQPIVPLVAWVLERQHKLDQTGGLDFLLSLCDRDGAWLYVHASPATLCVFADTVHGIAQRKVQAKQVLHDAERQARAIMRGERTTNNRGQRGGIAL